jgi:hypothetical protein
MRRVNGSTVSDIGVDLFSRPKKLPKSEKENALCLQNGPLQPHWKD